MMGEISRNLPELGGSVHGIIPEAALGGKRKKSQSYRKRKKILLWAADGGQRYAYEESNDGTSF